MDLGFDYESVKHEEFERRKELLILDLTEWITPKMNYIHALDHSVEFWTAVLGQHLSTCVNKKHVFNKSSKVPRYLTTLNVLGTPSSKHIIRHQLHFLAKTLLDYKPGELQRQGNVISKHSSFCLGPRAKELVDNGMGVYLKEYTPLLLFPKLKARNRWRQLVKKEVGFLRSVLAHLPLVYVEYFHKFHESPVVDSETKVFHAEHLKIHSTVLIAKYYEKGSKFYYYQGGAGYGEIMFSPRKHIYSTITNFRTYGWKQNPKDEPFPAYRLESFQKEFNRQKEASNKKESKNGVDTNILIVSHIVGITDQEVISFSNELYAKVEESFKKGLKLRLRPKSGIGKANKGYNVEDLNEAIALDKGIGRESIISSTLEADLTILMPVPSTHLYECVVVNQPFVCLNRFRTASQLMKPYIDFFYENGVFHDNMGSIAKHINRVDINSWWREVSSHEVFKDYYKTFCGGKFIKR